MKINSKTASMDDYSQILMKGLSEYDSLTDAEASKNFDRAQRIYSNMKSVGKKVPIEKTPSYVTAKYLYDIQKQPFLKRTVAGLKSLFKKDPSRAGRIAFHGYDSYAGPAGGGGMYLPNTNSVHIQPDHETAKKLGLSPDALIAHELGHATGPMSYNAPKYIKYPYRALYTVSGLLGKNKWGFGFDALAGAAHGSDADGAANTAANVQLGLRGLTSAALLGEEAQASIRGYNALAKTLGREAARKHRAGLIRAYGTYGKHLALFPAAAYGTGYYLGRLIEDAGAPPENQESAATSSAETAA